VRIEGIVPKDRRFATLAEEDGPGNGTLSGFDAAGV
jgi:hypothetical protein